MARLSLSEHTLDVDLLKCDKSQFDWADVEDYVLALTGDRKYQYDAIQEIMTYLWGGGYSTAADLARENFARPGKFAIRQRFYSEDHFLAMLPLPDRLSGVCHMATGTGKSFVMIAVAHLSLLLGKVQRVLVLGPSSTVIEEGLREKFKEYLYGAKGSELQDKLPERLRHKVIRLLTCNDFVEDSSIVIENINAIYTRERNSIGDWFDHSKGEVLVLSDEVHHAYSHLDLSGDTVSYDFEGDNVGKQGAARDERLWMKFIREEKTIRRHIGFTGTPYNGNDYFPDVICNYSIRDAIDEEVIKKINPILRTEADEGDGELTRTQRFEQIIQTHAENSEKYAYRDSKGRRRVKPITIFISRTQKGAKDNADEFVKVLADTMADTVPDGTPRSALESLARDKVITVVSQLGESDYKQKLAQIEETDPDRVGGKVEYIFAVNMLSEGWDVDNVFQIVPAEERVFNSKLLISQVLGRGLRMPRKVPPLQLAARYPVVTITNHERFAEHIRQLLDEVTDCELRLTSEVLEDPEQLRHKHHFNVFNLEYVPSQRTEPRDDGDSDGGTARELKLTPSLEKLGVQVTYLQGTKRFELSKDFFTVDQIVLDIERRFRNTTFESRHFDFGEGLTVDGIPGADEIEQVIRAAMAAVGIEGNRLSRENRQQIELYFNQFLPKGTKRVIRENKQGRVQGVTTQAMPQSSARSGGVDNETSAFMSADYAKELSPENLFVVKELTKEQQLELGDGQLSTQGFNTDHIKQLAQFRNLYAVKSDRFHTPQGLVITRFEPERQFVFRLVDHSSLITSWVKSPDSGFYGLDYEYWKAGKDRVRRSFNPDFIVRVNLADYLLLLPEDPTNMGVQRLREMQDKGVTDLMLVVEIKHDDDDSEQTRAKGEYGEQHFRALNPRLRDTNPIDFPEEFRNDTNQLYAFWILRPSEYNSWFGKLRTGLVAFDMPAPERDDEQEQTGTVGGPKTPRERLYAFAETVTRTDKHVLIHFDAVSAAQLSDVRPGSQQHFHALAETRTYHIEARLSPDQHAALVERQIVPEEEHWYALEVSVAGLWPLTFFDADTEEELGFANAVMEQLTDEELAMIRERVVLPPAAAAPDAIAGLFAWETPRPTFVSAYDVGQGLCCAICDLSSSAPLLYFDFGCGCYRNANTRPSSLRYCFTSTPPIVLSHWHYDHYMGARLLDKTGQALQLPWVAPMQSNVSTSGARFAARLYVSGRLFLWPAGLASLPLPYGQVVRCAGSTINTSGLALIADTSASLSGDPPFHTLLPGDAGYDDIPGVEEDSFDGLVVAHHGGSVSGQCLPRSPGSDATCILPFGVDRVTGAVNSYGHPSPAIRTALNNWGWKRQLETISGHAGLGIPSGMTPPALGCGGSDCDLEVTQM